MTAQPNETRGHDEYGRVTYTAARPQPHTVYGGYRMAFTDWVRTEDGWDCEFDYDGLPETIFATLEDCQAAIEAVCAAPVEMGRAAA